MAIIKCKMCGGDIELSADKTYGMCEFCGSTMTLPKIDDDQRAAAFNRGNHFRRIGEFDKALAVYERIVRENEADAEAHWCCALCRFGIEYVEDPATYEWLPTCHRASFDSFLEDVDYLAALEYSDGITRRQYVRDAAKIAEVQRGILATSQNAEPYDVFICYKESDEKGDRTRDSLMAQDIYYQLTEQGRKVFFARITLEDVAGAQYEPYIFAALNSAKVMIVVGTKPEHLNAVWVKNEWSRFLAMMKKDRHKLLLPCYRDMDPYDMPEALSVLQSYDMSKIGFIQDLTRGIAKVLDAEKKIEPVREPVVVQQTTGGNLTALLKRGKMALEDEEWDRAEHFYEEVLNQDAECGEAYLGSFLAQAQAHSLEHLLEKELERMKSGVTLEVKTSAREVEIRQQWLDQVTERYINPGLASQTQVLSIYPGCAEYTSEVSYWQEQRALSENYLSSDKQLQRAVKFADAATKTSIQGQFFRWLESLDALIEDAKNQDTQKENEILQNLKDNFADKNNLLIAVVKKRREACENKYQLLCQKMETVTDKWGLRALKSDFDELCGYKDCQERAAWCRQKIKELESNTQNTIDRTKDVTRWMANGLCAHCGGTFVGLFNKKCANCGKIKSY